MLCKMMARFSYLKTYHVRTREGRHGSMMYGILKKKHPMTTKEARTYNKAQSAQGKNQTGLHPLIISKISVMRCIRLPYLFDFLYTQGVCQFGFHRPSSLCYLIHVLLLDGGEVLRFRDWLFLFCSLPNLQET